MDKAALVEIVDWAIFTGGAFIAALVLPAHIIMTNIASPIGISNVSLGYDAIVVRLSNPLIRLYLFVVLGGTIWFCMHRIRFILYGIGLSKHRNEVTYVTFLALVVMLIATLYALI